MCLGISASAVSPTTASVLSRSLSTVPGRRNSDDIRKLSYSVEKLQRGTFKTFALATVVACLVLGRYGQRAENRAPCAEARISLSPNQITKGFSVSPRISSWTEYCVESSTTLDCRYCVFQPIGPSTLPHVFPCLLLNQDLPV